MEKIVVAKRTRRARAQSEESFGEAVEIDETPEAKEDAAPTFAEAKGSEANQHAKAIAKKQAAAKKAGIPSEHFFTMKGTKVLKVIVKKLAVHEVYLGNIKKKAHKQGLDVFIAQAKKENVWVEAHAMKDKIQEIRTKLPK